jgi:DNA polymerase-3 subunit epsilon
LQGQLTSSQTALEAAKLAAKQIESERKEFELEVETKKEISSMNVIVRPDGWSIPPELTAIHGISDAYAREVGVEEIKACILFMDLWKRADVRIAHNEKFDARILRIALKRFLPPAAPYHDEWKAGRSECTMKMAQHAMGVGKFPKLEEAYAHFFHAPPLNLHTAMGDVSACQSVYFALNQGVHSNGTTP